MKKVSKKQTNNRVPRVISMGKIDLEFSLIITDEILSDFKIDWDSIKEIEDLQFLKENKDLWDNIQLSSNNLLLNSLFFINKSSTTKSFVELIVFNGLQYDDKESFLKEILHHVTEHNYLFIVEADIVESMNNVAISLKYGKISKQFKICKEIKKLDQNKTEKECEEENLFYGLNVDFSEFDFFLIDLEEIFQNFQSNPQIILNFKNFIQNRILQHKKLKITINYPDIIKNVKNLNLETVQLITDIISYSDILVFEKKEALYLFNMFNQINNPSENIANLEEKDIPSYFNNKIKFVRRNEKKIGLFLNEFQKINVLELKQDNYNYTYDYEFQLYPKINHSNHKLIEEYRRLIYVNYSQLKSVFFGSFFSRFINARKSLSKEFYACFLTGAESTKKILELMKNKLDYPLDPEFYIVKISNNKIEKQLEKEELEKKEQKFVLDCVNKRNSHLKYYNPLLDGHLNSFFASEVIRKQLKQKGFINTEGFLMYDPNYRHINASPPKNRKGDENDKEKQLLYAIKSINMVDDFNYPNYYSKKLKSNSPTNKKLATVGLEYTSSPRNNLIVRNKKKLKPISTNINYIPGMC